MKKKLSLIPLIAAPLLTLVGCTSSHTHVLNFIDEIPANCETEGVLSHYECDSCNALFNLDKEVVKPKDLIIPKHHIIKFNEGTLPGCDYEGYYAHYECTHCHKLFKDEDATNETTLEELTIASKGGHQIINVALVPSTCDKNGTKEHYLCTVCNEKFLDEEATVKATYEELIIAPTGHNITFMAAKSVDCFEDGNIAHYYCDKCDGHFKDQDGVIEILDGSWRLEASHEFVYIEEKTATYYEDGYSCSHYHCDKCGNNYSDEAGENQILEDVKVHKYVKSFDFEDEIHPYIKELSGAKVSITSNESTRGNKSLKIELGQSGTFKLAFDYNYLTQIFKLSEVDHITFDIKGEANAKDLYYESKTNQYKVERYHKSGSLQGVTTSWRSISFTREMLNELDEGLAMIRVDNSVNNVIYIDNVRAARDNSLISFERNSVSAPDVDNNYYIYNNTDSNGSLDAMANGNNLTVELSNSHVSEGTNSLRIKTNTKTLFKLYIPYSLYLQAEGSGITFDLFVVNSDVMHVYPDDNISPLPYINSNNLGVWETYYIPFDKIHTEGTSYAIIFGNRVENSFEIHIDNIKVAKDYNVDFENEHLLIENNKSAMIQIDNRNQYEITSEFSYSGAYSLRIDPLEGYVKAFLINNVVYNNIPNGGGIRFYAYSRYEFNLGPTDNHHYWKPVNEWKEYVIPKHEINATPNDHWVFLISHDVVIYIDNISVVTTL